MLDDPARPEGATAFMSAAPESPFDEPALGASRVGAELRAARMRLGWQLPDVAHMLRIRLPYLEAIEDGRVADLPGNAYAVGFVRTYASSLGLDPVEVARRFRAEAQEVNRKTELAFPAPVPERGVPAGAVILLGMVLVVGAYAAWYKFSGDTRTTESVPAVPERLAPMAERVVPSSPSPQVASILPSPSATPPITPPPAPVAVPAAPVPVPIPVTPPPTPMDASRVMLRMKADSYIQVREKQGQVLLNRVMRTGETWPLPRGVPLLMTTGNAGGTEVVVEGVSSPPLGGSGVVRRDIAIDADTIKPGAPWPGRAP